MTRVLIAWCPNWPIVALDFAEDEVVAVVEQGRIVAASKAARALSVTAGQRRREAEQNCPGLSICERDLSLEARRFEPVAAAIGELTPLVEVLRPGTCALDVRGPARYFGGEEALVVKVTRSIESVLPLCASPPRVGIAEGRFAAGIAARRGLAVAVQETAAFLAPLSLTVLGEPELADLLRRLGIWTLGDFAQLPEDAVQERFGDRGAVAHHRARGLGDEPLHPEVPTQEFSAQTEFDPPVERVDVAAFAARSLADDLANRLEEKGLVCARLRIEAESEHAEQLSRLWRSEANFTPETIAERLRWQLEGWLAGTIPEGAPTAGITLLRITADEMHPATGRQLGLFGGRSDADLRAARSLDRLCGLLGPDAVFTVALKGGRGPAERVAFIPWGELGPLVERDEGPWPGHHPLPAPALVYEHLIPTEVRGEDGEPVRVLKRGVVPSAPHYISIDGGPWTEIIAWSGPWLTDERSWDVHARRRRSRFQILTAQQVGHLCVVETNRWWIEATYD